MARRSIEEPVETFRVKPNKGRGYFDVLIFKSVPAMRRHALWLIKKEKHVCGPGAFWAISLCYSPGPLLGRILFAKTKMSPGIVTHELTHAAIHWADLRKIKPMEDINGPDTTQEELFTRALHEMVDQFHARFQAE